MVGGGGEPEPPNQATGSRPPPPGFKGQPVTLGLEDCATATTQW